MGGFKDAWRMMVVRTKLTTYRQPLRIIHKYLRAGPADMPLGNWYKADTKHFRLIILIRWK